jgi:hypothetical protein
MIKGQLDLFSFVDEDTENNHQKNTEKENKVRTSKDRKKIAEEPKKEIEEQDVNNESHENDEEIDMPKIHFRPFPSVEAGDMVKVIRPIDKEPDNMFYFDRYKGKKGKVIDVKPTDHPKNYLYQFNVWVEFDKGDIGVFYDLELESIV